jgi:hypothetical protein
MIVYILFSYIWLCVKTRYDLRQRRLHESIEIQLAADGNLPRKENEITGSKNNASGIKDIFFMKNILRNHKATLCR